MPYAILLVSKLPNVGAATTATQHNYRTQDTPNADPQLADANVEYLNHERRNYWHLASERIDELHLPRLRGDAVRAVELVLTASPDAFPRGTDHRAADLRDSAWVRDNLDFVRQSFGEKNVLGFNLHQDEITPHIHCVVVPVTPDGRLSCRDVFSPASLRQLQTDYAEAMKPHGLTRGIHYSTARHEDVRRHYGAQQMSQDELRELTKPLQTQCHQIRSRIDTLDEVTYRDIERMRLTKAWGELLVAANHKITQLATIATAHALAHERAKVLERQLAHSQELLVKKHTELTSTTTILTKQLQNVVQERDKQRERADEQLRLHKRAVIRHSQGQPLSEGYLPLVQKLRQQHQRTIEQALAERLRAPISAPTELAATLAQVGKGYSVKSISPHEFSFVSQHDGTRFNSSELRPSGQPFKEQYIEAGQRSQQYNYPTRENGGIEM
jgi:hypothetical protein